MISFIEGEIAELTPAYVVINCNGVGYMLHISLNTYSSIQNTQRTRLFFPR